MLTSNQIIAISDFLRLEQSRCQSAILRARDELAADRQTRMAVEQEQNRRHKELSRLIDSLNAELLEFKPTPKPKESKEPKKKGRPRKDAAT